MKTETDMTAIAADWEAKWRKGALPFAALCILAKGPVHGYGLAVALRDVLGATTPEGTLYPLLNKFEADGLAVADWEIQPSGPARKVYRLSEAGETAFLAASASWGRFTGKLKEIVDDPSTD